MESERRIKKNIRQKVRSLPQAGSVLNGGIYLEKNDLTH